MRLVKGVPGLRGRILHAHFADDAPNHDCRDNMVDVMVDPAEENHAREMSMCSPIPEKRPASNLALIRIVMMSALKSCMFIIDENGQLLVE